MFHAGNYALPFCMFLVVSNKFGCLPFPMLADQPFQVFCSWLPLFFFFSLFSFPVSDCQVLELLTSHDMSKKFRLPLSYCLTSNLIWEKCHPPNMINTLNISVSMFAIKAWIQPWNKNMKESCPCKITGKKKRQQAVKDGNDASIQYIISSIWKILK